MIKRWTNHVEWNRNMTFFALNTNYFALTSYFIERRKGEFRVSRMHQS